MSDYSAMSTTLSYATLPQTPVPSRNRDTPESIRHAAGEFESILLNQWLESAESTFGSVPGADDEQDAGDAQMKSFAVQALAKGITAAGGIGLSGLLAKALSVHPATTEARSAEPEAK